LVILLRSVNYRFFFLHDTATTDIYTLSLHDALPIYTAPASRTSRDRSPWPRRTRSRRHRRRSRACPYWGSPAVAPAMSPSCARRSEEHTSELQSLAYLVCRLLLEKKKKHYMSYY